MSSRPASEGDRQPEVRGRAFPSLGFDLNDDAWLAWLRCINAPATGPRFLGGYELLGEIGRGGQGVVFKARQPHTGRIVAMKRLSAGMFATAEMRARFVREIEAVAALDHPGIVTVFGSEIIEGQPVLAMQWVDGVPVDRWVNRAAGKPEAAVANDRSISPVDGGTSEAEKSVTEILRVFEELCSAIFHAHQRGVIHRDLKPSNVLVDAQGQPHVLDFGLARLLSPFLHDSIFSTHTSGFVGTPAFASPEQFGENDAAVDVRSDVFSLGCMLYQALTGQLPHGESQSFAVMVRAIQEQDPRRPSLLRSDLDRELDAITLKALAKRKDDRYPSVEAMAEDLRRYRSGLPVLAHPPGVWYRARKAIRRHRVAFGFSAAMLILIIAFAISAGLLAVRERQARLEADWSAYAASISAASAALRADDAASAQQFLHAANPELRNWEWAYFSRQADNSETTEQADAVMVGLDAQGVIRARVMSTAPTWIGDEATHELCYLKYLHDGGVAVATNQRYSIASEPGAPADATTFVQIRRAGARRPTGTIRLPGHVLGTRFSPNGNTLALWSWDGALYLARIPRDAGEGTNDTFESADVPELPTERIPLFEGRIAGTVFDRASARLAVSGPNGEITILDVESTQWMQTIQTGERAAWALAFSPDGRTLASGSMDRRVTIWNLADGTPRWHAEQHRELVSDLAFNADGSLLATTSWDRSMCIWDAASGVLLNRLVGHAAPIESVAFLDGGDLVATMDRLQVVKTWRRSARLPTKAAGEYLRISGLAVPADNDQMRWAAVVEGHDAAWLRTRVSLIDTQRRRRAAVLFEDVATSLEQGPRPYPTVCASPTGRWLAIGTSSGDVELWDGRRLQECVDGDGAVAARPAPEFRLPGRESETHVNHMAWDSEEPVSGPARSVACVSISRDDRTLLLCRMSGALECWDLETQTQRWIHAQPEPASGRVCAISPDGWQIAALDGDTVIQTYSVADGRPLRRQQMHLEDRQWRTIVFSPDGALLVPLIHKNEIVLYHADTLHPAHRLVGHGGAVRSVAFSPDGSRLASAASDGLIKIWDVASGQLAATLHGHELDVTRVAFTADGKTLISAGYDNTIRFWDAR